MNTDTKVDIMTGVAFTIFLLTFPIALLVRWLLDTQTGERWAESLPYWPRPLHFLISAYGSYYWMPCSLCGRWYGGHEPCGSLNTSWHGGHTVCRKCASKADAKNKAREAEFNRQEDEFIKRQIQEMKHIKN